MVEITIVAVGIIRYKEKRKSSTCHSLDLLSHHLRLLLGQRVWQFYWHIFVSEMCHSDDVLYRRKESKYRQNWQCMFVWQTNTYPNQVHCFSTLNSHICRLSNADWRTSLLNYKIVTCLGSVFYFSSFLSYSITWSSRRLTEVGRFVKNSVGFGEMTIYVTTTSFLQIGTNAKNLMSFNQNWDNVD